MEWGTLDFRSNEKWKKMSKEQRNSLFKGFDISIFIHAEMMWCRGWFEAFLTEGNEIMKICGEISDALLDA